MYYSSERGGFSPTPNVIIKDKLIAKNLECKGVDWWSFRCTNVDSGLVIVLAHYQIKIDAIWRYEVRLSDHSFRSEFKEYNCKFNFSL